MKQQLLTVLFATLLFTSCKEEIVHYERTTENFGSDWTFTKDKSSKDWDKISLPHTAQIEPLIVNNQWRGSCWYQKEFKVELDASEKYFFHFEGVMHVSKVYINNVLAGSYQGGYTPFEIDATPFVKSNQKNIILVEVNNENNPQVPPGKSLETLDFNYYGGIYRNVYCIKTKKIYVPEATQNGADVRGGALVHFDEISKDKASGKLSVFVKNDFEKEEKIKIKTTFKDADGKMSTFTSEALSVASNKQIEFKQNIEVQTPKLWNLQSPHLYEVIIEVLQNDVSMDQYHLKTGIRRFVLNDEGFFINGEKTFLNGTNRHQEYPYLGYAISDEAQYRDAVKIKNAGFDFVRLSHYPQANAFLNTCDELGIVVMNCISGWQFFGDSTFKNNSLREIKSLARRDGNHPSVAFWEVSLNESNMTEAYMMAANKTLKTELPFNNIYTAGWMDHPSYDLFIPARQHGKAPDYWNLYDKNNRKIIIAEYGDWEYYAQNAGFNQTAYANLKEDERTSRQLRKYGHQRLLQQALNFQEAFNSNLKGKNTIGHANWLMFDYNRGYADDLESSGISDIFRIPKYAHYFYQSQRSPMPTFDERINLGPMVYIANDWANEKQKTVTVYSNCESVSLYLNDQLIETKKPTVNSFSDALKHPPFIFELSKYKTGTLKAVGMMGEKSVATHELKSPEKASKLELSVDLSNISIHPNHPDVVFVYAKIVDENGTLVTNTDVPISFEISEGENAILIGENPIVAEAGIATILLKTESFSKPISIKAKADSLSEGTLILQP